MGTVYRPPSQGSFTEAITEHFSNINTNDREIKSPIRVTCSTSSLIDHISQNWSVSQQEIIDVGLSIIN